jgi:cytochrome c
MNFQDVNKGAGALLGAGIWAMVTGMVSSIIFAPEMPAKPGYAVATAGAAAKGGGKAAEVVAPIEERLKSADAGRGQKGFSKCSSCHTPEKGGAAKVGPNLWGVVAGPKAHVDGFKYSPDMLDRAKAGEKWTYGDLDKFLTDPKAYMKGTAMGFAGIKDPADRADVIAYLRSLADSPAALP